VIALDTNVLVRFLVKDDQRQSAAARRLVERAMRRKERLFISDIVLFETQWVLVSVYKLKRGETATILRRLLSTRALALESASLASNALESFEGGRGDFADYLIREKARAAGCTTVATFDAFLLKEPGFRGV